MKQRIIALLFTMIMFVGSLSIPTAVAAAPTSEQSIAVFHPNNEKTFAVGRNLFTLKTFTDTASKNTLGDFSVAEITVAPQRGSGLLLEKHVTDVEDNIYPLTGEFEFFSFQPNKTIKAHSGDIIRIPAGTPYGLKNVSSEASKLVLMTSQGFSNFIEEVGTPVTDSSSIPLNSTEPSMEKVASVARKYGIQFLN